MSKQGKALSPQFKIPLRLINIGLLLQTLSALAGIFLFFWMPSHYGFNFKSLADYPDLIGIIGDFILYGIFGSVISEKLKRNQNCSKLAITFGIILLVVTVIATFGIAYWWYAYFAGVSAKAMTPAQISLVGNTDMLQLQHTCYNYILQICGYASAILMLSAGAYLAGTVKSSSHPSPSSLDSVSSNPIENSSLDEPHTHYRRLQHNVEDSAIKYHTSPNRQKNVGANDVLTEFKHPKEDSSPSQPSSLQSSPDTSSINAPEDPSTEDDVSKEIQELKDPSYQDKLNQYIASAKHVEEESTVEEKTDKIQTKPSNSHPDSSVVQNTSGKKQNKQEKKKDTNSSSISKKQNDSHKNSSHSTNSSQKQNHRNNKKNQNQKKNQSHPHPSKSSEPNKNLNQQNRQDNLPNQSSHSSSSSTKSQSSSHSIPNHSVSAPSDSQNRKDRGQSENDKRAYSSSKPKPTQRPRHPQVASQRESNLKKKD